MHTKHDVAVDFGIYGLGCSSIDRMLSPRNPISFHRSRLDGTLRTPRVHYKRRVVEAIFGFVLGIGMLLGGVISKYIWVAVAGFVVMLACAMWALNSYRHMNGTAVGKGQPRQKDRKKAKSAKVSMMERLEERWRRRQERER
jgi:fatty-acid desaturase